jgi:hypothetical protein
MYPWWKHNHAQEKNPIVKPYLLKRSQRIRLSHLDGDKEHTYKTALS